MFFHVKLGCAAAQASSTTKRSGLCHFAVCTTMFLLFAVLDFFFFGQILILLKC